MNTQQLLGLLAVEPQLVLFDWVRMTSILNLNALLLKEGRQLISKDEFVLGEVNLLFDGHVLRSLDPAHQLVHWNLATKSQQKFIV